MSLQDLATAQGRYDAQEPPDEQLECGFCENEEVGFVTKVFIGGKEKTWPEWQAKVREVPCPYCLAGTPLARSLENA